MTNLKNSLNLFGGLGKEKYLKWLIYFFLLITILKIVFTLPFQTPWILADEAVYADIAKNIWFNHDFLSDINNPLIYPPGYPLILSISYFFADKNMVYHVMLAINAIISSLIIFPSYFISKNFVNNKFAFIIAVLISIAPSNILYTFVLMSENLFVLLFLLSIYFLIEALTTENKIMQFLAGFSIAYLYLTKSTGIAMIIAFCLTFSYYILIHKNFINTIKNKFILVMSLTSTLVAWLFLKKSLYGDTQAMNSVSGYPINDYFNSIIAVFKTMDSFLSFIELLIHEINYIIVASFLIFTVFAVFAVYNYKNIRNKDKFNVFIIYTLITTIILIVITVTHMYGVKFSLLYHGSFDEQRYDIFGRYLVPILPVFYILGGIGLEIYSEIHNKYKFDLRLFNIVFSLFAVTVIFFPDSNYKLPNMLSIYYIQFIKDFIPTTVLLMAFLYIVILFIYKKNIYIVLIFVICASLVGTSFTYQEELFHSSTRDNQNQIGHWLQQNSTSLSYTLMDKEDFKKPEGHYFWFLTYFWKNGELKVSNDLLNISDDVDYVISSEFLPYEPIISNQKYTLYDPYLSPNVDDIYAKLKNDSYQIYIRNNDASHVNNFWNFERGQIRWTKNISKIKILYPKDAGKFRLIIAAGGNRPPDSPAKVKLYINDKYVANFSKESGCAEFMFDISQDYLNSEYQILTIETNTWNPSDYGSKDGRDLGIQVDWIKIENYRTVDDAN